MKIRIKEDDWNTIRNILDRSFNLPKSRLEWGVIGSIKKIGSSVYLITDVIKPENKNDLTQTKGGLCFASHYIRRAQLLSRKNHGCGLIFFHTHPFSINKTDFSCYDNIEEPSLIANLNDVWPHSEHISIVVAKDSRMARVYQNANTALPISEIFVVGKTIKVFLADGTVQKPPKPEQLFERAYAITDNGALAILGKMSIAVIGAGGTGSLMVELLRRAGCKNLILIDDDFVDRTNLNRLLHASVLDARENRKKVHVAASVNHLTGMDCNLEVLDNNLAEDFVQEKLKDADLLIGCVDKDTPRYILNKLAIEAYLPYIDLGTEIGVGESNLQSLDVRVTYVYPGGPCLLCRDLISFEHIRLEGLSQEERRRHIGMGYCDDIDIKQPAVMELNMRAASLASLLVRHLIQPFLDCSLEMDMRESLLTLSHRQPRSKSGKSHNPCSECGYSNI